MVKRLTGTMFENSTVESKDKPKLKGFAGRKHSEESKRKISISRKGKTQSGINMARKGENNGMWKGGDLTTIEGIHYRIRQQKQKPEFCEICGLVPPQELSNIDHKYSLLVRDYRDLCIKCHRAYDDNYNKNFKSYNENKKRKVR